MWYGLTRVLKELRWWIAEVREFHYLNRARLHLIILLSLNRREMKVLNMKSLQYKDHTI